MKAYKIKSLLYLSCFIIAAVVYYQIEQDENFQNSILSGRTADLEAEDHPSEENLEDVNDTIE
jgi:hypothetical protein